MRITVKQPSTGRMETALKERWTAPQGLTHSLDYRKEGLAVNATRTCTIDGCDHALYRVGLCRGHYARRAKYGDDFDRAPIFQWGSYSERIFGRIDASGPCWEWLGFRNDRGYGVMTFQRVSRYVHRRVWELLVGPVPQGLELDHLCRNHACCNPDHLEPVTHAENVRRGASAAVAVDVLRRRYESPKKFCKRGHVLDDEAYVHDGRRQCRACRRITAAQRKAAA